MNLENFLETSRLHFQTRGMLHDQLTRTEREKGLAYITETSSHSDPNFPTQSVKVSLNSSTCR